MIGYAKALLACAALCLLSTAPMAKTYDAVRQFSTVVNSDKSVWSYRASDGAGHDGNYALLTSIGSLDGRKHGETVTLPDWNTPDAPYNIPLFLVNSDKAKIELMSNKWIVLPARTMDFHPGYSNVAAVLSFLAKTGGTAKVTYKFTHLDWTCKDGAGINWSVEKNFGNGSLASGFLHSPNRQNIDSTGNQQLQVTVAKGDRINFIVDPVADPPHCDTTGITASVTLP